jgi:hypothetical protein
MGVAAVLIAFGFWRLFGYGGVENACAAWSAAALFAFGAWWLNR